MPRSDKRTLDVLAALHGRVDGECAELTAMHRGRLQCALGCKSCCVDALTVFEVEAERIRAAHPEVLTQPPHPEGACAFLDPTGACRIYDVRPYVCRTQGLPLRWLEEDDEDEIVEQRDICPLNDDGTPLDVLPEEACWLIGPSELALVELQERHGGELRRVALRALFRRDGS